MPSETMDEMADPGATPAGDYSQEQPKQEGDETTSVFLPKSALPEGKKYSKGDKIELTVMDVDPETGDVEACCYDKEDKASGGSMGYQEAFEKAMPEES